MSPTLDSATSHPSLGAHYEDKLRVKLANVWQGKFLILGTLIAAFAIGIALALLLPKRYTAEAYVRGGLTAEGSVASNEKDASGAIVTLDASILVETRSRLLQSQQLARRVVERLGLERIRPVVSESSFSSWWHTKFYGDATSEPGHRENRAADRLMRGLSVRTEPRVYLIKVSYTAGDSELAAIIANAFVVELLQVVAMQTLSHQRDLAVRSLSKELANLKERHPRVIAAKMRLQAADALLRAQLEKTTEEIKSIASGDVTFARSNSIPSSPNPPILIGIALLVGLAGSVALVALRERPLSQGGRRAGRLRYGAVEPSRTGTKKGTPINMRRGKKTRAVRRDRRTNQLSCPDP